MKIIIFTLIQILLIKQSSCDVYGVFTSGYSPGNATIAKINTEDSVLKILTPNIFLPNMHFLDPMTSGVSLVFE